MRTQLAFHLINKAVRTKKSQVGKSVILLFLILIASSICLYSGYLHNKHKNACRSANCVSVKAIPLIELRHFHDSVDDLWPKWYSKLFSRNEIMMLNEIFLPTKSQKNNQSCQMTKPLQVCQVIILELLFSIK